MSTSLIGAAPRFESAHDTGERVAIITAEWNQEVTHALRDGAVATLTERGFNPETDIDLYSVPGAIELTYGASLAVANGSYDAVIIFGCVVRGGTPHFDYVCQSVTQGMTSLNAEGVIPVIFGVLTVDSYEDALDRAGGRLGNKGIEAAEAAIEMIKLSKKLSPDY